MKRCPQCDDPFEDADQFCPTHGGRLIEGAHTGASFEDTIRSLVGQTIDGRYVIERILGEGAMGVVFKAHHAVIEKTVAIKMLKIEDPDGSMAKRFLREAKAASKIAHPDIVDVTDFGTLPNGIAYLVMEFVAGETLSSHMHTAMDKTRALPIIAKIAQALVAAHKKGIVHRDLKPDNIFLLPGHAGREEIKIVDFGIAKVSSTEGSRTTMQRLTRAGSVFGTPEYMAPEQAEGGDTDARVDVYAVGIMLYQMLVGRVPLKSDNPLATLAMQIMDPITLPRQAAPERDISPGIERVIMHALEKKRDQRTPSMLAFLKELERAADVSPDSSPHFGKPPALAVSPTLQGAAPPGNTSTMMAAPSGSQPHVVVRAGRGPRKSIRPSPTAAHSARSQRSRWKLLVMISMVISGVVAAAVTLLLLAYRPDTKSVVDKVAVDAQPVASTLAADAGPGAVDSGKPYDDLVRIVVRTDPAGGEIYSGRKLLGSGKVVITRKRGTRMTIHCRTSILPKQKMAIVFDGQRSHVVCKMQELKGFPGD